MELKKPFEPGGTVKESAKPKLSKAQLKRAGKLDPQRFKLEDQVMTKEGPAIVKPSLHITSDEEFEGEVQDKDIQLTTRARTRR